MKTKNYLGRHDENRGIILFCVILCIVLILVFGLYIAIQKQEYEEQVGVAKVDELYSEVESEYATLDNFQIIDNTLIIEGKLEEDITNYIISKLNTVEIVLKNEEGDVYVYPTDYYISTEAIEFSIFIDDTQISSINLDEIISGEYFVLLRIMYDSTSTETGYRYRYYMFENATDSSELLYNNMRIEFKTSDRFTSYLTITTDE